MAKQIQYGGIDREELARVFGQITGEQAPDLDIVLPKIETVTGLIRQISTMMKLWSGFVSPDKPGDCQVVAWADWLAFRERLTREPLIEPTVEAWIAFKRGDDLREIIRWATFLRNPAVGVADRDNLHLGFMRLGSPDEPLWWTSKYTMDLRRIFTVTPKEAHPTMLLILHRLRGATRSVWEQISSPDVNMREVAQTIIAQLGRMRRRCPRCDDAFDRLANAVDLLETKFADYYRESVAADNQNVIFEAFISDVCTQQTGKKNPAKPATSRQTHLRWQFREILRCVMRDAQRVGHQIPDSFRAMLQSGMDSSGMDSLDDE